MHRLAVLAVVLMVCAPLVSRWLAAGAMDEICAQGQAESLAMVGMSAPPPMQAHDAADMHMAHHSSMSMGDMGMSGHVDHGALCAYCVLAANLLPGVLILLVLLAAAPVSMPLPVWRRIPVHSLAWPAHPARGPPLAA